MTDLADEERNTPNAGAQKAVKMSSPKEYGVISSHVVTTPRPARGMLEIPTHMKYTSNGRATPGASLFTDACSDAEEYCSQVEVEVEQCIQEVAYAPVAFQECIVEDFELIPSEEAKKTQLFHIIKPKTPPPHSVSIDASDFVRLKCKRFTWPIILLLVVGFTFICVARGHLMMVLDWLEHLPWLERFIVFILLFTMVSFPFGFGYIVLNMMAGYLYGVVCGQAVVMVSVAVGFSIAFFLCRSSLRDYARETILTSNALQAVMRVVEGPNGFKVVVLTRLTPVPFGLQNVLFAMTSVSYTKCLLGSIIGLLPTQILNTYMGSTVRNMQEVMSDRVDGYIVLAAQVIFTIILMLYLLKKARSELAKLTRSDEETGDSESDRP